MLFISINAFSQLLTITPDGLRATENLENDFIILNVPGKTASEMYGNLLKNITRNDQFTIKNYTTNEYIELEVEKFAVNPKTSVGNYRFNDIYNLAIDFKDNKVRLSLKI